jgi:hyperosmotically inducible protein
MAAPRADGVPYQRVGSIAKSGIAGLLPALRTELGANGAHDRCGVEQTAFAKADILATYPRAWPPADSSAARMAPRVSYRRSSSSRNQRDGGNSAQWRRKHTKESNMNYKLATTCFVIGTALASVSAHAADGDSDRNNPANYVKDSVITTKIKTQLAVEHPGSMKHIKVDTDKNGVVWMTGTANTQEQVDQAVAIARNTEGVKSVKSELKVQKDK